MADIRPFRALRYDPSRVSPADVITQPYDKITPAMQEAYYAKSPYNLVRVILGKTEASDSDSSSVYTRAADAMRDWRKQDVLRADAETCIYSYLQDFVAPGENIAKTRTGFIALGRLQDYSDNIVYRHEQTLAKPKSDRLNLLRATHRSEERRVGKE